MQRNNRVLFFKSSDGGPGLTLRETTLERVGKLFHSDGIPFAGDFPLYYVDDPNKRNEIIYYADLGNRKPARLFTPQQYGELEKSNNKNSQRKNTNNYFVSLQSNRQKFEISWFEAKQRLHDSHTSSSHPAIRHQPWLELEDIQDRPWVGLGKK